MDMGLENMDMEEMEMESTGRSRIAAGETGAGALRVSGNVSGGTKAAATQRSRGRPTGQL